MDRWLDQDGQPATRTELHYGARIIRCFVERGWIGVDRISQTITLRSLEHAFNVLAHPRRRRFPRRSPPRRRADRAPG